VPLIPAVPLIPRGCLVSCFCPATIGDGKDWTGRLPNAFNLIELDGDDLRREPLDVRKAALASVLAKAGVGLRLNEHLEHDDGELVFRHACKLGLEGIVSKRLGSRYRSGRSPDWLKMKNPDAPAVKREAEED
jgi:bifunctional non-homologous end joining protein LigD